MKIAIVAPIEETVPPQKYGGTEWIVYHVTDGMAKRGHQVDLLAAGNSPKSDHFTLIPIAEQSIRTLSGIGDDPKKREVVKLLSFADAAHHIHKNKYDIVHNHGEWRFLLYSNQINTPIVNTHHKPYSYGYMNIIYERYKHLPFVSISDNQRKDFPGLNFAATVYNGIDLSIFPFSESGGDYMAFLARMSDEKGALEAAATASKLKKKLIVAAKVDLVDEQYFAEFKSVMDPDSVEIIGEIGPDKRLQHLQNAKLLLAPIKWEEPFGLMFTEAMAVGTPVIAFARGSTPEIIVDGETGFLVNQSEEYKRGEYIIKKTGVEGLCEAVERIYSMSDEDYKKMRHTARRRVEENFTVEKMVEGYEKVYNQIISNP